MFHNLTRHKEFTPVLLRAALALVFAYAAISSFRTPTDWVGYLPAFLRDSANATTALHVFSVVEMVLAVWFITGKFVKYAALLAAAMLAGIVLANLSLFAITFRDMALLLCALALFFAEE